MCKKKFFCFVLIHIKSMEKPVFLKKITNKAILLNLIARNLLHKI